jgi:hypothetical protein
LHWGGQGSNLSNNPMHCNWLKKKGPKLIFAAFQAKTPVPPCLSSCEIFFLDFRITLLTLRFLIFHLQFGVLVFRNSRAVSRAFAKPPARDLRFVDLVSLSSIPNKNLDSKINFPRVFRQPLKNIMIY